MQQEEPKRSLQRRQQQPIHRLKASAVAVPPYRATHQPLEREPGLWSAAPVHSRPNLQIPVFTIQPLLLPVALGVMLFAGPSATHVDLPVPMRQ
ncbi:hypothetical protein DSECCO2_589670 [anaerobic digester metagenome]